MLGGLGALNKVGVAVAQSLAPSSASLNLDFTLGSLDSRITFSRGSQATLFDSTGALVYAKHNLLSQSEDAVSWAPSQLSVSSNSILAPNGTLTADTLTEDTTTNFHRIQPLAVTFVSGFQYTFSVFLKNGDRNFAQLFFPPQFSTADYANFDISTGALGTVGGSATASIVSVGSGWYRCSVTATATSSGTGAVSIGLITSATAVRAESYLGASKFIYVWGIQLNLPNMEGGVTSSLSTYYPTVASAYYAPRFDYNPSTLAAQGLLIEEQRTNSILQSEDFATTWGASGASVLTNTAVSPSGTTTADSIVEDGGTSAHRVAQPISADSTLTYTATVFIKSSGRTWATILLDDNSGNGCRGFYNLSTGVVGTLSTNGTASGGVQSITAVGNGWYRCGITCKPSTVSSGNVRVLIAGTTGDTVSSYAGTNGLTSIFAWGAQLEAGAFATSYIPTTTTALTRNADVASMTGTNFSSWFNATEGTLLAQVIYGADANCKAAFINNGAYTNLFSMQRETSLDRWQVDVFSGGSRQALLNFATNSAAINSVSKCASAYKVDDFSGSVNGGTVVTDTSGLVPVSMDRLALGRDNVGSAEFLNGWLQRISYYPVRLPNSTLQALTT